ncbi:MAG: DUF447 family protein [Planctomycetota bacterium]|nr:DUF447 family protein [Planctomycetota bacterium]
MILEGIVTTTNDDGSINVAPMGPIVDASMQRLHLRPFQSSTTYANLKRDRVGVFHVVDDVLLLAQAAINCLTETPPTFPATIVSGHVLADACRWYEFQAVEIDDHELRTHIFADVVHTGRIRNVFGFNRAKHAVLEAAILATRLHILPRIEVEAEMARLAIPVEKTAGDQEREAFRLIAEYIDRCE